MCSVELHGGLEQAAQVFFCVFSRRQLGDSLLTERNMKQTNRTLTCFTVLRSKTQKVLALMFNIIYGDLEHTWGMVPFTSAGMSSFV